MAEIDPEETTGETETVEDSERDDDSSVEYWKGRARQHERTAKANADAAKRASDAERRLSELQQAAKPDNEKELDKVRAEAADRARKETLQTANRRIIKSEIRAEAAGKLADPEDAVRFLDFDDFIVSDDGDVDTKALAQAVAGLLKDKPYLAAETIKRKHGDGDGGARGRSGSSSTMNDILRGSTSKGRLK